MILALAGQFKQLSHEPEKLKRLNGIRTHDLCDAGADIWVENIAHSYGLDVSSKWYKHKPEGVIENDHVKLLWDFNI